MLQKEVKCRKKIVKIVHFCQGVCYNERTIEYTRGDCMIKKEMIAMLLAGGQGSRLGVLTAKVAKPAVTFGGKYRIIDCSW